MTFFASGPDWPILKAKVNNYGVVPPLHVVEEFMLSLTGMADGKCSLRKIELETHVSQRWSCDLLLCWTRREWRSGTEIPTSQSVTSLQGGRGCCKNGYPCGRNNVSGMYLSEATGLIYPLHIPRYPMSWTSYSHIFHQKDLPPSPVVILFRLPICKHSQSEKDPAVASWNTKSGSKATQRLYAPFISRQPHKS